MDRFLDFIDRGLEIVCSICVRVSGVFLILMFIFINIEVLGRYVFRFSTLIEDEFVSYFFVWMTFLGFAATLRRGQFLRVNVVLDRVPRRVADLLQGFAALVGSGLCWVLAYCSGETVRMSFLFKSVSLAFSQTPLVLPQSIMPVAMALLALVFLSEGILRLKAALHPPKSNEGPVL